MKQIHILTTPRVLFAGFDTDIYTHTQTHSMHALLTWLTQVSSRGKKCGTLSVVALPTQMLVTQLPR